MENEVDSVEEDTTSDADKISMFATRVSLLQKKMFNILDDVSDKKTDGANSALLMRYVVTANLFGGCAYDYFNTYNKLDKNEKFLYEKCKKSIMDYLNDLFKKVDCGLEVVDRDATKLVTL